MTDLFSVVVEGDYRVNLSFYLNLAIMRVRHLFLSQSPALQKKLPEGDLKVDLLHSVLWFAIERFLLVGMVDHIRDPST